MVALAVVVVVWRTAPSFVSSKATVDVAGGPGHAPQAELPQSAQPLQPPALIISLVRNPDCVCSWLSGGLRPSTNRTAAVYQGLADPLRSPVSRP